MEARPEWVKIYSSTLPHKVNIVKAFLEDNHIKSFDIDKKDSSYTFIGEIELYVQQPDAVLARFLIEKNGL
jgi:hypothetical protein